MSTITEMAEAHLLNVQREIQVLNERKVQIDQEIEKLTSYLNDGARELQEAKSDAEAELAQVPEVPIQVGPTNVTFTQ
jgi:predicted  nucleic acid-binding Zn-ribbon protein